MAGKTCRFCSKDIGYMNEFYLEDREGKELVHAICRWKANFA